MSSPEISAQEEKYSQLTIFPWIIPTLELLPYWLSAEQNKLHPWIVPTPCLYTIILVGVAQHYNRTSSTSMCSEINLFKSLSTIDQLYSTAELHV